MDYSGAMAQENLTDLSAWRQVKAAREGGEGGFAGLWNAHAPAIWSVIRPLCRKEEEAVGWCSSLRLVLSADVNRLDPSMPLLPQIGVRLFQHLAPAFRGPGEVPLEPLPPTPEGVAQLPSLLRLAWLAELFFDLPEPVFEAEPDLMPRLRAARRVLEPPLATAQRAALRLTLLRVPPPQILVLPPGTQLPKVRGSRWYLWILFGFLLVLALGTPLAGAVRDRWVRKDAARVHAGLLQAGARPPGFLPDSAERPLTQVLRERGVEAALQEVPDLRIAGLSLEGGLIAPGAVLLFYRDGDGVQWIVQHHIQPHPGVAPDRLLGTGDGPMKAWSAEGVTAVGWRDGGGLWIVGAVTGEADVLSVAALARQIHPANAPR